MSGSRIPRPHSETCVCFGCQARRRKLQREAERPRRVPAEDVSEVVGVSASTIHRLARGGVKVDPATQRALEGLEFVGAAGDDPSR